jgi:hypothetical protein
MTKRCATWGLCLTVFVVLGGCQRSPAPAPSSVDANAKPLSTVGVNEEPISPTSLPTPGNDGGPELEGLIDLGPPAALTLPDPPQIPDLPPVPELPDVSVEQNLPPVPQLPGADLSIPSTETPDQPVPETSLPETAEQ